MSYIRKIRVEYYQVIKTKRDESGNDEIYDLEKLILKADSLSLKDRIYNYYQEEARLDKISYRPSTECYYLNFVRMRQTKIPVKAKRDSESTAIPLEDDEYIGEDVSVVYDKNYNIIALQKNRDSLGSSGLGYYLSKLLDSDVYEIILRPVPLKDINERIAKVKGYRKLVIKLATDRSRRKIIPDKSSFHELLKFTNPFESRNVSITISMGRGKGFIDAKAIYDTIQDIKETSDFVNGAELSVKYNDSEPVQIIDLFAMKYHNFIWIKMEKRESIDFIDMCDEIHNVYISNRENIIQSL